MSDRDKEVEEWFQKLGATALALLENGQPATVNLPAQLYSAAFNRREAAGVLAAIEKTSMTEKMVLDAYGINANVWRQIRDGDAAFDALVRRAKSRLAGALMEKVEGSNDRRSAAWLLENTEQGGDYVKRRDSSGGGVTVVIGVVRDERIAFEGGVIDPARVIDASAKPQ